MANSFPLSKSEEGIYISSINGGDAYNLAHTVSLGKDVLEIVISSNGNDYNPFINHQEKYVESFDPEMDEGGFGLSIIKDLASSYDYKYEDEKSITIVRIKL